MKIKPFAFVLMPFDKKFDDIYKLGIQSVASELGVVAERVDEQTFSETILERIYRQISSCDFVIADMTGRNPNVFYEVGYAHAKGKLCTLLTQDAEDIPFDLKHHRHLVYKNIHSLKQMLRTEFAWLKGELDNQKSKTFEVELKKCTGQLKLNQWNTYADGDVEIIFDIHNKTDKKTPDIEAMYFHTGKGWKFFQGAEECPSNESSLNEYPVRHFIKPPLGRLSPGAWGQVRLSGRKQLWSKFKGDPLQDSYRLAGNATLEIVTSEGHFREQFELDVLIEEIPF